MAEQSSKEGTLERVVKQPTEITGRPAKTIEISEGPEYPVAPEILGIVKDQTLTWAERASRESSFLKVSRTGETREEGKRRREKSKLEQERSESLAKVYAICREGGGNYTADEIEMMIAGLAIASKEVNDPSRDWRGGMLGGITVEEFNQRTERFVTSLTNIPETKKGIGKKVNERIIRKFLSQSSKMDALKLREASKKDRLAMICGNPDSFLRIRLKEREERKARERPEVAPPPEVKTTPEEEEVVDTLTVLIMKGGRFEDIRNTATAFGATKEEIEQARQKAIEELAQKAASDEKFVFGNLDHRIRDEVAKKALEIKGQENEEQRKAIEGENASDLLNQVTEKMAKDAKFRAEVAKLMREEDPEEKKNKLTEFLKNQGLSIGVILLALLIQMFTAVTSEERR